MRISDWSSDVCSSDLFEKQNPDITIKYEVERGGTEALQQFLTAASSNTLPDLALLDGFWISRLVETGKLQPLNDLWGEESRAHWLSASVEAVTLNGNIYARSEEHTSELQSLMRSSYAVFCLKTKKTLQS